MAPSATSTQSGSLSSKIKRPVPPGIQTNGINSSTSSPSPSMSASRLPSGSKVAPNSATSNGVGNNSAVRSANRTSRRDTPGQLLGRGQRHGSVGVGLRSGSIIGDSAVAQPATPQPYVKSDEYIMKKYRGQPPSLIIHLHPTHFRFDQQEGSFSYKSPMKMVLEHIRSGTIPHDLIEYFTDVPFYEGCMIVQVHDHKSAAPAQGSSRTNTGATKTVPFSVHNYNAYLTPSSYVPYLAQNTVSGKGKLATEADGDDLAKSKTAEQVDKENMPAPTIPNEGQRSKQAVGSRKPRIHTVVLHSTPLSNHVDLATKAAEARFGADGRRDSRQDMGPLSATVPPTPTTAVPSTPQTSMAPPAKRVRRTKVDLDSANIHAAEAQIVHFTTARLSLDPVSSARESAALLSSLAHPMHSEKPPLPKTRKRTVAEMAADEALAAEQERYMLILDERLSSNTANAQGGANPTDGDGQAGGASFEPRFEKFKALENIKNQHEENKRIEKQRRDEAERKLQQERERNKLRDEAKERDQEKMRNMAVQQAAARHQQQQQQQQAQQEAHRRSLAQQAQQSQQGMQGVQAQVQVQHAHPQANGIIPNGIPAQPQRFHQQQVSQAQTSSPIVRNGTPQSHSSPTVNNMGNVPMQPSTSSMGGSPPRPGSVVQQNHSQMGAPTAHGMSAQRSQQSHAGTPRMPNSTPNVQSTPLNRQMSQTPRMSQGSPMQGPMAQAPQMQMMNGQVMQVNPQQQALQQQRLQMMQNQQAAQRMGGMMGGHQLSPQQLMQAQMMRQQQQQQQQQAIPNQLAQNYAATMAAMAQRSGGMPPNMNQNFMNNPGMANMQPMNMQQMQQMQQMRQAQAQAHAQAQAQAQAAHAQQQQMQQQQHPQQVGINPSQQMFAQQVMAVANTLYNQQKPIIMQQYPNGIVPDDAEKALRSRCQQAASQQVTANFRARRQQMMAAQGGMQQMNGMQNGM